MKLPLVLTLNWALVFLALVGPAAAQDVEVAPPPALSEPADAEPAAAEPAPAEAEPGLSVEELTRRVAPSIVVISSSGRDGRRQGVGTGFVVSSEGLVATNFHVIGQGRRLYIQLLDGRQVEASAIHAFDRALDLAVLRVDAKDIPALELGDSDQVRQGQNVIALGNPQGFKNSVVAGVVSGVREVEGRKMIQMAIPIEPGNSGGPVVDAEGRVQGIMTMKSLVTPNLGFALTVNLLKPLLEKPNPIPMARWQTIGVLDPHEWKPVFGADWRQRAGHILVEAPGEGFGGRTLCLSTAEAPAEPYEVTVEVRLDDESGAAGLVFCCDGDNRHYGFYPSGGRLRFTEFNGPDVRTWSILYNRSSPDYLPGEWNSLRVRLGENKIECFVNDQPVWQTGEVKLSSGRFGLVKFRDTKAEFKRFQVGPSVGRATVPDDEADRIVQLVEGARAGNAPAEGLIGLLAIDATRAATVLRSRAAGLERQAEQLRQLASAAHERRTIDDLLQVLARDEESIDLFRAGLLVARLDNEDVDVGAYCRELERMADEITTALPADAGDDDRLAALRTYLFEQNGFHGSRGDYYNRSNSYLNEVLDDREGLPITLSVIYMELARRIGVNVVGVGLPGHFIVAHQPKMGEPQLIDVFDAAAPLTRQQALERIREAGGAERTDEFIEAAFKPVNKRAIVFRMLQNLLSISSGDPPALHRYLNAMLAVEPAHANYHWLRAVVRYELGDREAARQDVAWLLEREPEGVQLDQVRALQAELDREEM